MRTPCSSRRPCRLRVASSVRYALLSDVHANIHALRAVLNHIAGQDRLAGTYHLGDLVGYAPWPNETVALLRESGVAGIAGNYDSTVATSYKHCGCKYEDPRQEKLSHVSFQWTLEHVDSTTKEFLGRLPFRLDVRPFGGHIAGPTMFLVHGAPTLNTLYWTEDRPDSFCLKMAGMIGAKPGDLIAFGHTHKPWHRAVDGIHFVNTGSVGRPKDRDWRACYALLDFAETGVDVEFVRVEYDVDAAMKGIIEHGLPGDFAEQLRLGGAA